MVTTVDIQPPPGFMAESRCLLVPVPYALKGENASVKQVLFVAVIFAWVVRVSLAAADALPVPPPEHPRLYPVSYTHLTLPTKRIV